MKSDIDWGRPHVVAGVLALTAGGVAGCTWETELPDEARSVEIDVEREILVTDPAIASGPLAMNGTNGPLGFAAATEALRLNDGAMLRWLESWPRFDARITCRWLRAEPANACDASCASCSARTLRPEAAPFRLLAIANRVDLSVMPDRAGGGGEGRLVFAVTDGPGDDETSPALPITVAFEYAQTGPAIEWARRWHTLGASTAEDFPRALVAVTDGFVAKGTLAQVRTADAWSGPMLMHEVRMEEGELVRTSVRNSPDWSRVGPASMRAFVDDHEAAIEDGTAVVPEEWCATSSSPSEERPGWVAELPRHDALVGQTCGGCHAKAPSGFHVDPTRRDAAGAMLSDFMRGEIARRRAFMQLTLSAE